MIATPLSSCCNLAQDTKLECAATGESFKAQLAKQSDKRVRAIIFLSNVITRLALLVNDTSLSKTVLQTALATDDSTA